MRVDTSESRFSEAANAAEEFGRDELRHCKTLLRRLQFLESKVEESGGIASQGGGAAWAEWEAAALEWALTDNGYLVAQEVSRNTHQRESKS